MAQKPLEYYKKEYAKCALSFPYFCENYVQLFDTNTKRWVPYKLWPEQFALASNEAYFNSRQRVCLKARQLGQSWFELARRLWKMVFYPAHVSMIFSRRDEDAKELLNFRLKGMFYKLPLWLRPREVLTDRAQMFELSNGSRALAFPTTGGRSFTANDVLVDEADFITILDDLLIAVKPTIDAGGEITLLSTSDKANPNSTFKNVFRAAQAGENGYTPVFLPWTAAPWRTQEWYNAEKAAYLSVFGSTDKFLQEYPATAEEALAANSLDKRFPPEWVNKNFYPVLTELNPLGFPGLVAYALPQPGETYFIGADSAEGNPTSDFCSASVIDHRGNEVALLRGRYEPALYADYLARIAMFYNSASLLPERNNHGYAVLLALESYPVNVLRGIDGKPGWLSSSLGKAQLYNTLGVSLRDGRGAIHSRVVFDEISSIEGATLRAPVGMYDDASDGYALAHAAAFYENNTRAFFGFNPLADYRG